MRFRPDIEGLRAVAIIPVVLYHITSDLLPGGFIGVDVFFVISGFLISKIIIDGIETESFSLVAFYRNRMRRIFPALFFMLIVVSVAATVILFPLALKDFGEALAATVFFVSNYRLPGYFDEASELKPLLHAWSLAVEEQFYILFPFVLLATKRWLGGRYIAVLSGCLLISVMLCAWLVRSHPNAAFYFGPTRAFEFLIGALLTLGVLPNLRDTRTREIAGAAGIGLILFSAFAFDNSTSFPWPGALVPCVGSALVIHSGQTPTSFVAKILSLSPVRFFGAISYSLYLWHWPILSLTKNYSLGELDPISATFSVFLAIVIAIVSWRFIEQPFRRHSSPMNFFSAGISIAGIVAIAVVMIVSGGFPRRYSTEARRLFKYYDDFNPRRSSCHGGSDNPISYVKNCYYGGNTAQSMVAIWGDSHGAELSAALGGAMGPHGSVMEITSSSCPPALHFSTQDRPDCAAHNLEAFEHLTNDHRIRTVLLIAYYSAYLGDWPIFRAGFEEAVAGLIASGKQVILIYPTPRFPYPVPGALGLTVSRGFPADSYRIPLARYQKENAQVIAELNSVASRYLLKRVMTADVFCKQQFCSPFDGRNPLLFDDNHMSMSGAQLLARAALPLVLSSLQ